jgi:hypothetical protein
VIDEQGGFAVEDFHFGSARSYFGGRAPAREKKQDGEKNIFHRDIAGDGVAQLG